MASGNHLGNAGEVIAIINIAKIANASPTARVRAANAGGATN